MRKIWTLVTALVILLIPIRAFASSISGGYEIPDEDYNLLLLIYTPEYISTMTYDEYMSIMSLNFTPEQVSRESKYYKVVTNILTKEVDTKEITEEEYEAYKVPANNRTLFIETAYEKITLSLIHVSTAANYFSLTGKWKVMPSERSYDDIGIRIINFDLVDGSQTAKQIYKLNGTTYSINYPYGGINSKYFTDGYGVSMGLIGSDVTELQCTTSASLTVTQYPAYLFGSYQHAVDTITLTTAKNYTIGAGAGGVFVFASGVGSHYDGMNGILTYVTS